MEHKADGMMEQMCSSDFGECWGPLPGPPAPDKGLPSPSSDGPGKDWLEGMVLQGQPHGTPPKALPLDMHGMGAPQEKTLGGQ